MSGCAPPPHRHWINQFSPHDLLIAEVKASPWIMDHKEALSEYNYSENSSSSFPYKRIALGRLGPGLSEEALSSYGMERGQSHGSILG